MFIPRIFRRVGAALAVLGGISHPAGAAVLPSPTTITDIVTVQPIFVCGGGTLSAPTDCATTTSLAAWQKAANLTYAKSGLGVAFLKPTYLIAPEFLNTSVTVTSEFPTGTPTDEAHRLMYGAGHGQSSNPNTINLWLTRSVTRSDGGQVYGLGFIGGNGVVMPTRPNSLGRVPALDTLTHEIGHNIGLLHVDGTSSASPFNLMQSSGRTVPGNPCQIAPNTCGGGTLPTTDNLLAGQDTQLHNPLWTVDLAHGTVAKSPIAGCNGVTIGTCFYTIGFTASGPTDQWLMAVKMRFLDDTAILGGSPYLTITTSLGGDPTAVTAIPGGGSQIEQDFAKGDFGVNQTFALILDYLTTGYYDSLGAFVPFSPAFSVEFDFSSGVTSTALFDESGMADSNHPLELGFNGTPTYGTGKVIPVVTETDIECAPYSCAAGTLTGVPEPASALLLGSLLLGVPAIRRRL